MEDQIFDEFSIGKKVAKNATFEVSGPGNGEIRMGLAGMAGSAGAQKSAEIRVKVRHALNPALRSGGGGF